MSGYADDFSKSKNAVAAEAGGRFPASALAKRLGVKTGAIKALVPTEEWHHTSGWYNVTQYFREDVALEMIDSLRAWRPVAKGEVTHEGCTGEYLEWGGTRSHPRATVVAFGPVRVTQRGDWYILDLPKGQVRKGKETRGFVLRDGAGRRLTYN